MKLLVAILALVPVLSIADGLRLRENHWRYPGEVLVFQLTPEQKQAIEHSIACQPGEDPRKKNTYTSYTFSLTPAQAEGVRKRVGFAPSYFQVFQTVLGYEDACPCWNLVLRYSEDSFEIPVDLLLPDSKAKAEHEMQGWIKQNPCFPEVKLE